MSDVPDPTSSEQEEPGLGHRLFEAASSLQCKATVFGVALTLAVMGAVAGYLLQSSVQLARGHLDTQLVQLAGMLARSGAPAVADGDLEELQSLAGKTANGAPLHYVVFSDLEGRPLASAEHQGGRIMASLIHGAAEPPSVLGVPTYHASAGDATGVLEIVYPVSLRTEGDGSKEGASTRLLGYVRTGMQANLWYRSLSSRLDLLIGVGVVIMALAVPLGFLLVRRIVSPMDELAKVMSSFTRGKMDVRCKVRGRDEIGRLAMVFNRLADEHQISHERIVRLNEDLEQRVAKRTRQLRELASREPLTGLYNRRHFNEVLERRFHETMRYQGNLSCMMLDLDDFKRVNDEFGHQTGDEVLILTGRSILSQLRASDLVARFGGDEFIILLPQTDPDHARFLAERIAEQFSRDVEQRYPGVRLTMSIGLAAVASLESPEPAALIRAADRALYQAKAAGKSCIITADPRPGSTAGAATDPTPSPR